jgi:lactoylglutathione lyase
MHLYEAHLPVANTEIAQHFYTGVVGLPFAYRDPSRDIVFLWAASKAQGMIGLWGPTAARRTGYDDRHHIAFAVSLDQLFDRFAGLRKKGIETLRFNGDEIAEPSVIGWMPSAQVYFRDPDGHLLEFISILPEQPQPNFIGTYSEWKARASQQA